MQDPRGEADRPPRRGRLPGIALVLKPAKKGGSGAGHRQAGDGSPQPLDRLVERREHPPTRSLQIIAERKLVLPPPRDVRACTNAGVRCAVGSVPSTTA